MHARGETFQGFLECGYFTGSATSWEAREKVGGYGLQEKVDSLLLRDTVTQPARHRRFWS